MTRNRQVRLLRCWLLVAIALAVSLLRPDLGLYLYGSFALVPLGLFMPVFASVVCANCDGGVASSVQVVASGIANGLCTSCGSFNGTFVLANGAPGSPCVYSYIFANQPCCPSCSGGSDWTYVLSTTSVFAQINGLQDIDILQPNPWASRWRQTVSTPYTCQTNYTSIPHDLSTAICNGSAATVDVTML